MLNNSHNNNCIRHFRTTVKFHRLKRRSKILLTFVALYYTHVCLIPITPAAYINNNIVSTLDIIIIPNVQPGCIRSQQIFFGVRGGGYERSIVPVDLSQLPDDFLPRRSDVTAVVVVDHMLCHQNNLEIVMMDAYVEIVLI